MEDDRVEANSDKVNFGKVGLAVFAAIVAMSLFFGLAPEGINPSVPKAKKTSETADVAKLENEYDKIVQKMMPAPTTESKKDYIASTTTIGGKKAPIYYKEFFKNPLKFEGRRINLPGKIMVIEESNGETVIQMQVTGNYDSVIVHYNGSVPVYQEDRIMVYGEGGGVMEGHNRMGAAMTWPVINAKYIVKRASAEE